MCVKKNGDDITILQFPRIYQSFFFHDFLLNVVLISFEGLKSLSLNIMENMRFNISDTTELKWEVGELLQTLSADFFFFCLLKLTLFWKFNFLSNKFFLLLFISTAFIKHKGDRSGIL